MDETEWGLEEERSSNIRRKDLETVQNEIVWTGEKANGWQDKEVRNWCI